MLLGSNLVAEFGAATGFGGVKLGRYARKLYLGGVLPALRPQDPVYLDPLQLAALLISCAALTPSTAAATVRNIGGLARPGGATLLGDLAEAIAQGGSEGWSLTVRPYPPQAWMSGAVYVGAPSRAGGGVYRATIFLPETLRVASSFCSARGCGSAAPVGASARFRAQLD